MLSLLWTFLGTMRSLSRTRQELALENLALRQQVAVPIRTPGGRRLRLGAWDRAFWVILSQGWTRWRETLAIVEPATVCQVASRRLQALLEPEEWARTHGSPRAGSRVVSLIRRMAQANVTWGAPRIRNELAKLGIEVAVAAHQEPRESGRCADGVRIGRKLAEVAVHEQSAVSRANE